MQIIKYFFFTTVFMLYFSSTQAQGAIRIGPSMTTVLNDYESYFLLGGALTFETKLKPHLTFCGTVNLSSGSTWTDEFKRFSAELRPEVRYYLKEGYSGFFIGGFATVNPELWKNTQNSTEDWSFESIYLGPGLSFGSVMKLNERTDVSFQLNAAANLGDPYFPVGGMIQLGRRF